MHVIIFQAKAQAVNPSTVRKASALKIYRLALFVYMIFKGGPSESQALHRYLLNSRFLDYCHQRSQALQALPHSS